MVSEEELVEILQKHEGEISSIKQSVQTIPSYIEQKLKSKEDQEQLPWYVAKTPKAMQDQLEKMGVFAKDQPGLQDDFDNAFRMFTQVSERGDLIQGLTGAHGPASLIELYQTMDLRGLVWNYGVGWISALKGGWNSAIGAKKKEAEDFINELRKRRIEEILKPEKDKIKDVVEYMESSGKLEFLDKTRIPSLYGKIAEEWQKYNSMFKKPPKKSRKTKYAVLTYDENIGRPKLDYLKIDSDAKIMTHKISKVGEGNQETQVKPTVKPFEGYVV